MRTLARAAILAVLVAGLGSLAVSAVATTPKLPELPMSELLTPAGKLTTVHSHVTYQASQFPFPLRVTPPDGSWSGAQWKSHSDRYGGGPPFYGWAALGGGSTSAIPRGLILIMTAYAQTPSVAATVAGLRTRGVGATYEATLPVKLAGFSGIQFDGQVVGTRHTFVPFSPRSNGAKYYPDAYFMNHGEVFRITVLNVRGKTVVVFADSVALSADQFPAFLTKADQLLNTLRFPKMEALTRRKASVAERRAEGVTLTFANSDGDFTGIPEVGRFVDRVKTLSRGQLQLNVISGWGQGKPSYERTVVKDVQRGTADLAWVGVRVLDTFGVKSFQALQAPLLIDSYPLQRAVLRSDMPARMLADLNPIGLVGLSLVANELRHPFGTNTQLATPADFKGKRIRVYASEVQTLTMRALGARPSYEGWADVRGALTLGELQGLESDLATYVDNDYASVAPFATVNVTLWPRTIALVANARAFAALSSEQQGWLRQAAADATAYSLKLPNSDQQKLNVACRNGARAVIATPAELAALTKALAPVYTSIQRSTKTRGFLRAIRALKQRTPARPLIVPAGCATRTR